MDSKQEVMRNQKRKAKVGRRRVPCARMIGNCMKRSRTRRATHVMSKSRVGLQGRRKEGRRNCRSHDVFREGREGYGRRCGDEGRAGDVCGGLRSMKWSGTAPYVEPEERNRVEERDGKEQKWSEIVLRQTTRR